MRINVPHDIIKNGSVLGHWTPFIFEARQIFPDHNSTANLCGSRYFFTTKSFRPQDKIRSQTAPKSGRSPLYGKFRQPFSMGIEQLDGASPAEKSNGKKKIRAIIRSILLISDSSSLHSFPQHGCICAYTYPHPREG